MKGTWFGAETRRIAAHGAEAVPHGTYAAGNGPEGLCWGYTAYPPLPRQHSVAFALLCPLKHKQNAAGRVYPSGFRLTCDSGSTWGRPALSQPGVRLLPALPASTAQLNRDLGDWKAPSEKHRMSQVGRNLQGSSSPTGNGFPKR